MCFSPQASFTASVALFAIGLLTISRTRCSQQRMIASVPLLFSLQQACEGVLWLILGKPGLLFWQTLFKYGFLTFAFLIWPAWIPTALYLVETNYYRRQILGVGALLGMLWSAVLLFIFITRGAHVALGCYHIYYSLEIPGITTETGIILYNLVTILPFFISSIPTMWIFGLLTFLACLLTILLWTQFFVSVWCFFAAVLSLLLYATINYVPCPNSTK